MTLKPRHQHGASLGDYYSGTGSKKGGRGMAQRSLDLIDAMHAFAKAAQPITGTARPTAAVDRSRISTKIHSGFIFVGGSPGEQAAPNANSFGFAGSVPWTSAGSTRAGLGTPIATVGRSCPFASSRS